MTEAFRCARTSGLRADDLAGTASTVRAFLLVEDPGPWGVDAFRDSRLDGDVTSALAAASRAAGVRVNLVRRHRRRSAGGSGFRVFAAYADAVTPWLETAELDRTEALLDLDLRALGAGRPTGLDPWPEPLLCVCTHGRHDACCAEQGRPLAAALDAAHPEPTWEISHIGGDRFAGNALFLPHGLYYGRLDPAAGVAVAGDQLAGHVDLDHLRGRSSYPMPVQAAEIALRRRLGETRLDALRLVGRRRDGDTQVATFAVTGAGSDWEVAVRTTRDDTARHRLTCRALRDDPIPRHEVLEIRRVGAASPVDR